jgi:hypothetical protein
MPSAKTKNCLAGVELSIFLFGSAGCRKGGVPSKMLNMQTEAGQRVAWFRYHNLILLGDGAVLLISCKYRIRQYFESLSWVL